MREVQPVSILCPDGADIVVRFAAEELQRYLHVGGGVEASVVTSVGRQGTVLELAIEEASDPLARDAFAVRFEVGRIRLVGGSSRAVLYAVYGFLEEYLGCRWYYPDEEIVPEQTAESFSALLNTLMEGGTEKRWRPDFRVRMLRYIVYELGPAGTPIAEAAMRAMRAEADWMAKNRLNVFQLALDHHDDCFTHWAAYRALFPELRKRGIRVGVGGHCMFLFMRPEAFDAHPEWFAMIEGRRTPGVVFCTRNEEAVRHYLDGLGRFLDENPEIKYFAPWPSDVVEWCECDACRDTPVAERHMELSRRICACVKERAPDVEVTHFAYGTHVEPPEHERPERGMTVTLCTWGRDYAVPFDDNRTKAEFRRALEQWRAITAKAGVPLIMHEKYARHLGFGPRLLPVPVLSADVRFFKSLGVDGFELPMAFMGRWVKGLNCYVLARLVWDASMTVDGLVSGYFRDYYGPYADVAHRACEATEGGMTDWRYWHVNQVQEGITVEVGSEFPPELKAYARSALDGLERARALLESRAGPLRDTDEEHGAAESSVAEARVRKMLHVLEYAALEWRGLAALICGAELVAKAARAATRAEDAQVVVEAVSAFRQAARLDGARRALAEDPSLLPLHWDATGAGPYCVFRAGAPEEWLTHTESVRKPAQG